MLITTAAAAVAATAALRLYPWHMRCRPTKYAVLLLLLPLFSLLQLLRGFTDGLHAGDPMVKRLPCALQANDPLAEGPSGGNYLGARLPEDLAPKIDALNLHIYSFFHLDNGLRVGVHPEHPGSSMNGRWCGVAVIAL